MNNCVFSVVFPHFAEILSSEGLIQHDIEQVLMIARSRFWYSPTLEAWCVDDGYI
jgi:hypothetical protein